MPMNFTPKMIKFVVYFTTIKKVNNIIYQNPLNCTH